MISKSHITVRYAETDQMGITHHSVYPVWYEVARTDFIKQVGMHYSEVEKAGVMMPLVSLDVKYMGYTKYEDELTVEVSITKLTAARMEFEYKVYRNGGDKPVNIGHTAHAWTNREMRVINLKKTHPEIYAIMEKAMQSV
ncbi:acyl-CoA thioesterase [Candidatus Soleaferrea massiliensis]|uniref:acyl-CoA thioesterase n=1 Tax=Candidatus Soleaferrea massiliensis TaxID=1470354 RepID=UPI000590C377|nr:thioesterase family protein [Candidatus Soleaferrea massiliensis]